MTARTRLLAAIDPDLPRPETPEQLANRILTQHPQPNMSTLGMLMDVNYRPLLAAHELDAWKRA